MTHKEDMTVKTAAADFMAYCFDIVIEHILGQQPESGDADYNEGYDQCVLNVKDIMSELIERMIG